MDAGTLLTSFDGRINRKPYWIGTLLLIAISLAVILAAVLFGLDVEGTEFKVLTLLVQVALLYPSAALMVKRFHDRDRPGILAAVLLVPLVLKSVTDVLGITGDPAEQNALDYLLGGLTMVVGIWFFVELGCLRGTRGPNRYGPDPLGGAPALA